MAEEGSSAPFVWAWVAVAMACIIVLAGLVEVLVSYNVEHAKEQVLYNTNRTSLH